MQKKTPEKFAPFQPQGSPTQGSEISGAANSTVNRRRSDNKKDRVFTLQEHSDTIRAVWVRHVKAHYKRDDEIFVNELPVKPILAYFVKQKIALDRDKARLAIENEIGTPLEDENMISYREFSSVFCRSMFKDALIHSAETFIAQMQHKTQRLKDMNLKQKIDMYQRNQIVQGLMAPGTSSYAETKQILNNIE